MTDKNENNYKAKKLDRIFALMAVIIAGLSFRVAWQSTKTTEGIVQVNTYMALRQNFSDVISDIHRDFTVNKDSPAPPQNTKDWKLIENYWYHSFDEWYITTQLGPSLQVLWDTRYRDLITSILEKKAFREVLRYLIKEKFPKNDIMEEYGRVLQEIYKEKFGKNLCSK